ncbi:MAG: hypothetical protein ATN36_04320 [Epulopiscium sp. Nele67-Bin005]|nr:MAG: hypothetical protein ATN36_04320 [Epulopiscium sp. Nele67-Bin005]
MFKKILALGIGVVALTGCSATELELYNAMNETSKFEAYNFTSNSKIELTMGEQTITYGFDQQGYGSEFGGMNAEIHTSMNFDFGDLSSMMVPDIDLSEATEAEILEFNEVIDEFTQEMEQVLDLFNSTPFEMSIYVVDDVMYLSTDYIKQMNTMVGEPVPSYLEDIDYIDYGNIFGVEGISVADINSYKELYSEAMMELLDLSAEGVVTKEDDVYKVEMEISTFIVEILAQIIDELPSINDGLALGLEEAEILEAQASFVEFKDGAMALLDMFLDGNFSMEYYVLDGVHYQTFDVYLSLNEVLFGEPLSMNMSSTTEYAETKYREISLEGNSLTADEFLELQLEEIYAQMELLMFEVEEETFNSIQE